MWASVEAPIQRRERLRRWRESLNGPLPPPGEVLFGQDAREVLKRIRRQVLRGGAFRELEGPSR